MTRRRHRKKGRRMSSPPPSPPTLPAPFLDREAGRKRIEQEDNLVNHRFSWLIGSQAFLLTAFVLLRNSPTFYPRGENSPLDKDYLARTDLLVYLIAIAGLLIAVCSFIGVFAAFMAIVSWRSKVLADQRRYLTSDARWAFCGGLAAFLPGPVLACIWVLLLGAEWPLTRLTPVQFWSPIVVAALTFVGWLGYTWHAFSLRTVGEEG
jgi:uncharacterized membrane protein